ncbi:specifically androgen-regulated gene protein [Genypterus blacodes]|uniref:specifically androgen-regulated gene protein n=1 Tax=Genypterus blacodes TaxID=154954 RepID=UPI003F7697B7
MPKSDTWPGGTGLETMTGMDSAGSCDSVVSANSGVSDDSFEYLSAEERACLMFLEETIESLDTEEDSGLSNDEPDQVPSPGIVATKMADLSVSMSKSKLNGSLQYALKEPLRDTFIENKPTQSYLVPTPLLVASGSSGTVLRAQAGFPTKKPCSKPQFTSSSNNVGLQQRQKHGAAQVPTGVNDVVIPPPTKPRDFAAWTVEGSSPRGPLSYEALVHLRRSASTKKTPLCPTIDHTIDSSKRPTATMEVIRSNDGNLTRSPSNLSRPKARPPAVAPKPKVILPSICVQIQNETPTTLDSTHSDKHVAHPQKVRIEALQKLGLLKDTQPEIDAVALLPPPETPTSFDPLPNRFVRDPSHSNPSKSPSFSYTQVPTEQKSRPLQSSASFHHYSRREKQTESASHLAQTHAVKATNLERSATFDSRKNSGYCPEQRPIAAAEPVKTATAAQPVPYKPSNPTGYSVKLVPGMTADRREALRKLGLLKD